MKLDQKQQDILNNKYGEGKAKAMQILKAIGEGFRAERMVPITRAHVALSAQEADTWFARKMRDAGAFCTVTPSVNPGYCLEYFEKMGMLNEEKAQLMRETHEVYKDLGANLSYSCTPYLADNIPAFGEIVAFSETSATVYVNSVIGARTNRESSASALCAAITGYVPEYGMLLDENRHGNILVKVDAEMNDEYDFALLGMNGGKIGRGVPVFSRLDTLKCTTESLINLGAQLNVSGITDLFHIPGVTAEAATEEEAFGFRPPERTVTITRKDIDDQRKKLLGSGPDELDFVILGCPHYTYRQIVRAAELLETNPAKVPVWILTSAVNLRRAKAEGILDIIERSGAHLVEGTCVDEAAVWGGLAGQNGLTDSPKCAYYMRAFDVKPAVSSALNCLVWAGKGGITI